MSDAIIKAKELGNAIIQSNEYKKYQECKAVLEDKQILGQAQVYENAQLIIASGRYKEEDKLYKDAEETIKAHENNGELKEYIYSKKALEQLLNAINKTLAHVTGMDTGAGSCNGCSGCGKHN